MVKLLYLNPYSFKMCKNHLLKLRITVLILGRKLYGWWTIGCIFLADIKELLHKK